jgi:hypothetical protein
MTRRQKLANWLPALWLGAVVLLCIASVEAQVPTPLGSPYGSVLPPRLGISTGLEFTDNWDQSQTNREWDLKWTLTPNIAETYKLPFGNSQLTLANSFTFKRSLLGREDDTFDSPASANLGLAGRLGGWDFTLSEMFSFNNQPLESTLAIGEQKTAQYSNTARLSMDRRFGKLGLALGFRRSDEISPEEPDTEETTYELSATPSYYFSPDLSLFWSHTIGLVKPSDPARSDSIGYSTSIGLNGRITQTLSGSVGAGFTLTHLDPISNTTTNIPAEDLPGFNAVLALNYAHPLRPNTTHSLSLAHSPGVTALLNESNAQEVTSATYMLLHRLNRGLTLSPSVQWTHLRDIGSGGAGEVTDLIRLGASLGGPVTDEISFSLNYFYQTRMSNLPEETYDAHQLNLNFSQRFTTRLTGTLSYGITTESSVAAENFIEHTVSASLTQRFSPHLSGTLLYTYKVRDSKEDGDSYYENIIAATVTYNF